MYRRCLVKQSSHHLAKWARAILLVALLLATVVRAHGAASALPSDSYRTRPPSEESLPAFVGGRSPATAGSANLEVVGQTGGAVRDLAAQGNYVYLAQGSSLTVLDVSNPAAPGRAGFLPTPGLVERLEVVGSYAYLVVRDTNWNRILVVASVADPASPQNLGSFVLAYDYTSGYGPYMAVSGDHVYVADREGLRVISVADKAHPAQVAWFDLRGEPHSIAVSGTYVFAAVDIVRPTLYQTQTYTLEIVDVADPSSPVAVSSPRLVGSSAAANSNLEMAAAGNYLYVAQPGGLHIHDVADKARPQHVGEVLVGCGGSGCNVDLAVSGDFAYLGSSDTGRLTIVSLADKTSPQQTGSLQLLGAWPIAVSGDYVYVSRWDGNLFAVSVADRGNPRRVGTYETPGVVQKAFAAGDYVYTAGYSRSSPAGSNMELVITSVADRTRPQVVGSAVITGINQFFVAGDFAYVNYSSGLGIFSVADKANPRQVGSLPNTSGRLFVEGDYAYVLEGDGLAVMSVADKTNPQRVGFAAEDYYWADGEALYVSGDFAYIAREGQFHVFSVADKTNPVRVGSYYEAGGSDVVVAGDYAYVAAGARGLGVVSVANRANPRLVGFYDIPGPVAVVGVSLSDGVVYVNAGLYGLRAISVADPIRLREVGSYPLPYPNGTWPAAVHAAGGYAYVASTDAGLLILRLRDGAPATLATPRRAPAVPAELVGQVGGVFKAVASDGRYVYAGEGASLSILDFADPARPRRLGSVAVPGVVEGVALVGSYAYVADGSAGLRIISVADPANPAELGAYVLPFGGTAVDVAVNGLYAYVASIYEDLVVVDVADPTRPVEVGRYDRYSPTVTVAGGYLYLSNGEILSLADPAHPTLAGRLCRTSYDCGTLGRVVVAGDYAYTDRAVFSIADKVSPTFLGDFAGGGWVAAAVSESRLYQLRDLSDSFTQKVELRVLSLADPARPALVGAMTVTAQRQSATLLLGLALVGGRAYIATHARGLRAISVADPARPVEVGAYDPVLGRANSVAVAGGLAYVVDTERGLSVISVADPARPVHLGTYFSPSPVETNYNVAAADGYAYLTVRNFLPGPPNRWWIEMRVISVADPRQPTLTGTYTVPVQTADAPDLALASGYAYLAAGAAGLRVVSVADPAHPVEVGAYVTSEVAIEDVAVSGSHAYVALINARVSCFYGAECGGLRVVSLADPRAPSVTGIVTGTAWTREVSLGGGGKVYLSDNDMVSVISTTQPTTPTVVGAYPKAWHMAAAGDYLYHVGDECFSGYGGLRVVSAADSSRPRAIQLIRSSSCGSDFFVAGNYAYVVGGDRGLQIYRLHSLAVSRAFQTVRPGATFTITVDVAAIANWGGFQFRLNYDPALLRLERFSPSSLPTGRTWNPLGPLVGNGQVTYGAYSFGNDAGPSGGRTLAQVVFTALKEGRGALSLDMAQVADTAGNEVQVPAAGGQVLVREEPRRIYLPFVMRYSGE